MALTTSIVKQTVFGDLKVTIADVTPDDSWLAAGEALTAADLGLVDVTTATCEQVDGFVWHYDHANDVLLAYWVDLSSSTDAELIPVPNSEDLSGSTVRIIAFGQ